MRQETRKERRMAVDPIRPINLLEKRIPKMPLMITPKSGKNGTSQIYSIIGMLLRLPLHQIDIININGFPVPVKSNDDTQSYSSLSGSYRHYKKDKNLTIHRIQMAGKGNEGKVRRVEHQFNTHKDDNGVPSYKNPQHPYKKEDSA
jgi:hypothetical protein